MEWITEIKTDGQSFGQNQLRNLGREQRWGDYRRVMGWPSPPPDWNYTIFQYTLAGSGTFTRQGQSYAVPANHAFLCHISESEVLYSHPENGQCWDFFYVEIFGEAAKAWQQNLTIVEPGPIHLPLDLPILEELMQFERFNNRPCLLSIAQSARLANRLFESITAQLNDQLPKPSASLSELASREIMSSLQRPLKIAEIAQNLGVSREHLSRVFKTELGQTPAQFALEQKIWLGKRLLLENHLSVKEAAARLGFSSPGHFSETFKKITGHSPSQL